MESMALWMEEQMNEVDTGVGAIDATNRDGGGNNLKEATNWRLSSGISQVATITRICDQDM